MGRHRTHNLLAVRQACKQLCYLTVIATTKTSNCTVKNTAKLSINAAPPKKLHFPLFKSAATSSHTLDAEADVSSFFASKPFSTSKLRLLTICLLFRVFNRENHELGTRFQRGETESLPKILFRWLCLPSFPLAGKRRVVFQRRLCETRLQRTATDQDLREAVSAGIISVGSRANDLDHHFPAFPCTVGRGG